MTNTQGRNRKEATHRPGLDGTAQCPILDADTKRDENQKKKRLNIPQVRFVLRWARPPRREEKHDGELRREVPPGGVTSLRCGFVLRWARPPSREEKHDGDLR